MGIVGWGLLATAVVLGLLMGWASADLRRFRQRVPRCETSDDLLHYQALISRQMKAAAVTLVVASAGFAGWMVACHQLLMRPQAIWWLPGIAWVVVAACAWWQRGRERAVWQTPCDTPELQDRWRRLNHIWRRYFWPRFDRALVTESTEAASPPSVPAS